MNIYNLILGAFISFSSGVLFFYKLNKKINAKSDSENNIFGFKITVSLFALFILGIMLILKELFF